MSHDNIVLAGMRPRRSTMDMSLRYGVEITSIVKVV